MFRPVDGQSRLDAPSIKLQRGEHPSLPITRGIKCEGTTCRADDVFCGLTSSANKKAATVVATLIIIIIMSKLSIRSLQDEVLLCMRLA